MSEPIYDDLVTTYDDATVLYEGWALLVKHPAAIWTDLEAQAIWTVKQGVSA